MVVNEEEVTRSIISFPPGSGAGPDGLRPQHLKDLISKSNGEEGSKLLTALTDLTNIILSGEIPRDICPLLFGASLVALEKKAGGIRPIAVGCTLRRLTAKVACSRILKKVGSTVRPNQLGFGTPGGTEAIVHATRRFLGNGHSGLLLKLDFYNAFNTVRRPIILERAEEILPDLYPFIEQAYGSPSTLMFGEHLISSAEGLQQGDPLAPALFCLVIDPVVKSLRSSLNAWYLDDGTLGGTGPDVLQDLKKVIAASSSSGLVLNGAKCELLVAGGYDHPAVGEIASLLPGLKILNESSCQLLGAPLNDESLESIWGPKVTEIETLVSRLPLLSSHTALFLLMNCLAIPKLMYLLRCSPAWRVENTLRRFDQVIREGLEKLTNIVLNDPAWIQASLPVARGGIGVRSAWDLAIPAFLASTSSTEHLVSALLPSLDTLDPAKLEAMDKWLVLTDSAPAPTSNLQSAWEFPILERRSVALLDSASSPTDKARILAVSRKESGAWLNTIPISKLGTFLDNDTLRISVGLRLGTQLSHPHICKCGASVDAQATHGLKCQKSAGRWSRHGAINDIVKRACNSANIPSTLEPSGLFRDDGKRPDGLTLIPWAKGRCLVWDATCVDTLAACYVPVTSKTAGAAAAAAETKKHRRYHGISNNYTFCPIAVETLGPFGDEAMTFLKELGKRLIESTGEPRSTSFLFQRISIAVQRGNAASILATIPDSDNFRELHDM
jgi:hypothetical protein